MDIGKGLHKPLVTLSLKIMRKAAEDLDLVELSITSLQLIFNAVGILNTSKFLD